MKDSFSSRVGAVSRRRLNSWVVSSQEFLGGFVSSLEFLGGARQTKFTDATSLSSHHIG